MEGECCQPEGGELMEKPLQFIYRDDDGKMRLNEEVKPILEKCKEGICVISIVGKYRSGKSYIMNRFCNRNSGFELGSKTEAKTRGIWIWVRNHPLKPEHQLVLLDIEGLGDVKKAAKDNDMHLFCLAVLLSKILIYNKMNALDTEVLTELECVTGLTEYLTVDKDEKKDDTEFKDYFPTLVFLLRDFHLELERDGKDITEAEYMEDALQTEEGLEEYLQAKFNRPRECIKKYFPEGKRFCFTLPWPVLNPKKLKGLDAIKRNELNPDFLNKIASFTEEIYEKANIFKVGGVECNGKRFYQLAEEYVHAFSSQKTPCILDAAENLRASACQEALEKAQQIYEEGMEEVLPVDDEPVDEAKLTACHNEAFDKALKHFTKKSYFGSNEDGSRLQKFKGDLEKKYQTLIEKNKKQSSDKCTKCWDQCFKEMAQKMEKEHYNKPGGYVDYDMDEEKALKQYDEMPGKGPMAADVRNEKLSQRKNERSMVRAMDKSLSEAQKKETEEREKEKEIERLKKEKGNLQKKLEDEEKRRKEEGEKVEKSMKEEFEKQKQELTEKQSKLREENVKKTLENRIPGRPTNVAVSDIKANRARVSWNAPSENVECVSLYRVSYESGGDPKEINTTSKSHWMSNLWRNTRYRVTVRAISKDNVAGLESETEEFNTNLMW